MQKVEFLQQLGQYEDCSLQDAAEHVRDDKEVVLKCVKRTPMDIKYASMKLRADIEIATAAVGRLGIALQHVHESLQDNYEVALCAVKNRPDALQFVSPRLLRDVVIASSAIKGDGMLLSKLPCGMKDLDIVFAAVNENGKALLYAPDKYKMHGGVVRAAVKNRGSALAYAHHNFKSMKQVVLLALEADDKKYYDEDPIIDYIPLDMRDDKDIAMAAVERDGKALYYLSERMRNDPDVVLAAAWDLEALECAPDCFFEEKELVMSLVAANGRALCVVDERFRSDKCVVTAAVGNDGVALMWASEELQDCEEVVFQAVKNNKRAVQYAGVRALRELFATGALEVEVNEANRPRKRLRGPASPTPSE